VLEDNDVFGNAFGGVEIKDGGKPTLISNRITRNAYMGVHIHTNGAGTFKDNDLRENAGGPWSISEDSVPNVVRTGNIE
jgi:parallel beta-helix repeat protein